MPVTAATMLAFYRHAEQPTNRRHREHVGELVDQVGLVLAGQAVDQASDGILQTRPHALNPAWRLRRTVENLRRGEHTLPIPLAPGEIYYQPHALRLCRGVHGNTRHVARVRKARDQSASLSSTARTVWAERCRPSRSSPDKGTGSTRWTPARLTTEGTDRHTSLIPA